MNTSTHKQPSPLDIRDIPELFKRPFFECLKVHYPEFVENLMTAPDKAGLPANDPVLNGLMTDLGATIKSVDVSKMIPFCTINLSDKSRQAGKGYLVWTCPACNETHTEKFNFTEKVDQMICPHCRKETQRLNLSSEDRAWLTVLEHLNCNNSNHHN